MFMGSLLGLLREAFAIYIDSIGQDNKEVGSWFFPIPWAMGDDMDVVFHRFFLPNP